MTTSNDRPATPIADLGWHMGAPPLSLDPDALSPERMRARFSGMRETSPTLNVWRGPGPVSPLPRALRDDIDALSFEPLLGGAPMRWDTSLGVNHTDGIVVLHRGRIVYEYFDGPLKAHVPHVCHSVTKSLVGTLAAAEVVAGRIDPKAPVTAYVPELAQSAWATATVRQTMDMTTALHYDEDYTRADAEVWTYLRAAGQIPSMPLTGPGAPIGVREFLQTVQASGAHGTGFIYKTVNTDVLGWIVCNVTGLSLEQLVEQRFWTPMGAEQDGYFVGDARHHAGAGGALSATLRDLARFGETMRCDGHFNGRQIVPQAAVEAIRSGASQADFRHGGYKLLTGWSYRAMWWITHNAHGAFCARGIHGQNLYIDPKAEMVIARFASHPKAASVNSDPTTLPAYHALARHLLA
jgi:CubicO group peptidase (beta-lactamase class C family)